jgi:hypothetical protein
MEDDATQEAEATVRDTMEAVWAKHHPAEGDEGEAPDSEEASSTNNLNATDGDRVRDPATGRFVGKNATAEEAPQGQQPAISTPAEGSGNSEAIATPATEPVDAPAHWPAEAKQMFARQTPEGRTFLLARDRELTADYTRKTQAIKPLADLDSHFGPIYARHGASTAQVAASLLNTHVALLQGTPQQKRQILTDVGRQFGVDLSQPHQAEQPGEPAMQAVQSLQQQVQSFIQEQQARQAAEQDSRNLATVQSFATTKNADGTPKYPHFDSVVEKMIGLIRGQLAPDLESAYSQAVALDPTLRAAEAKAQADKKAKAEEARKLTEAKKKAASPNLPKAPPSSRGDKPGNARETMEAVWQRHHGSNGHV